MNCNIGALAKVFVVGALIGILKTSPAADVINQDDVEIRCATFDIGRDAVDHVRQLPGDPLRDLSEISGAPEAVATSEYATGAETKS